MTGSVEDRIRQAMIAVPDPVADPVTPIPTGRRPIASRQSDVAKWAAQSLVTAGVRPNQISMASVAVAVIAFCALYAVGMVANTPGRGLLLIIAALAVQARLICNLLDGMVAVEGGGAERDGPFWNEAPDRLADIFILGGLGFSAGSPALGFLAGGLAVCTAYVRELGVAQGMPPDFRGPMAKQHRMAAVTGGALIAAVWPAVSSGSVWVLWVTLLGITLGTAATVGLRASRLVQAMRTRT